ncbi:MAG: primosomal protein N' [Bacteroidales bacterium]|nr:primosomal protein N' [Bacteroidales bacterium]
MEETLFAEILLPLHIPGCLTYRVPVVLAGQMGVGKRVVVPLGKKKKYTGIVKRLHTIPPQVPTIKYVEAIVDEKPLVTEKELQLWEWIAEYYLCFQGDVMQAALPSVLKLQSETRITFHPGFDGESIDLSEKELKVMDALLSNEDMTLSDIASLVDQQKVWPLVKGLVDKGVIITNEEITKKFKPKLINTYRLANDYHTEESLHALFDKLAGKAYKQLEAVMTFVRLAGESIAIHRIEQSVLLKESKVKTTVLNALVKKGVFIKEIIEASRFESVLPKKPVSSITLNDCQVNALKAIDSAFLEKKPVLLHGVTGSGKTEIYIRLIQQQIDRRQQTLYLLPEIALTSQIINRLQYYFGDKVMVYHSGFNEMERAEVWQRAAAFTGADNDPFVLLGARSALFLPLRNPGLVIVDEEHDTSFKQNEAPPRYNARDVAIVIAKMFNIPVILGSATPAVESYYNAETGKYALIEINKRFSGVPMPEIMVADLRKERKNKTMQEHFSSLLVKKMKEALNDDEQIILFQNRRGFSLRLFCTQCGWTPECPHCDVSLTYHEYIRKIKCHYCGYSQSVPTRCEVCNSAEVKMAGFGTERIENELPLIFPDAKVNRMDLETTRKKHAYAKIFEAFETRETDILVGTQMVSKGLDFDNVGVVGIMNADNMINFPDFRSFERSFMQITQVSGRAGRKNKRGRVVIQSSNPDHDVIRFAINNDYQAMYKSQLMERKQYRYPPFFRIVLITLKGRDRSNVNKAAEYLAALLKNRLPGLVLGPEYPLVPRIKNQFLKQIMVKLPRDKDSGKKKSFILKASEYTNKQIDYKQVRIILNVDPY